MTTFHAFVGEVKLNSTVHITAWFDSKLVFVFCKDAHSYQTIPNYQLSFPRLNSHWIQVLVYYRGLKLKFIGGPHSKEKILRGPQLNTKKKLPWAAISKKNPQNKLNLVKIYSCLLGAMFAGRTNTSGGPHAARMFETPGLVGLEFCKRF